MRVNLAAAQVMFRFFGRKRRSSVHEIGELIGRFLDNTLCYPQEWNDFIETKQRWPESERFRVRCRELDTRVSTFEAADGAAIEELLALKVAARADTYLDVATRLEQFVDGTGGQWDWDDFTSVLTYDGDAYLQGIQQRMCGLSDEFPAPPKGGYCGPEGLAVIREYVVELRKRPANVDLE